MGVVQGRRAGWPAAAALCPALPAPLLLAAQLRVTEGAHAPVLAAGGVQQQGILCIKVQGLQGGGQRHVGRQPGLTGQHAVAVLGAAAGGGLSRGGSQAGDQGGEGGGEAPLCASARGSSLTAACAGGGAVAVGLGRCLQQLHCKGAQVPSAAPAPQLCGGEQENSRGSRRRRHSPLLLPPLPLLPLHALPGNVPIDDAGIQQGLALRQGSTGHRQGEQTGAEQQGCAACRRGAGWRSEQRSIRVLQQQLLQACKGREGVVGGSQHPLSRGHCWLPVEGVGVGVVVGGRGRGGEGCSLRCCSGGRTGRSRGCCHSHCHCCCHCSACAPAQGGEVAEGGQQGHAPTPASHASATAGLAATAAAEHIVEHRVCLWGGAEHGTKESPVETLSQGSLSVQGSSSSSSPPPAHLLLLPCDLAVPAEKGEGSEAAVRCKHPLLLCHCNGNGGWEGGGGGGGGPGGCGGSTQVATTPPQLHPQTRDGRGAGEQRGEGCGQGPCLNPARQVSESPEGGKEEREEHLPVQGAGCSSAAAAAAAAAALQKGSQGSLIKG